MYICLLFVVVVVVFHLQVFQVFVSVKQAKIMARMIEIFGIFACHTNGLNASRFECSETEKTYCYIKNYIKM